MDSPIAKSDTREGPGRPAAAPLDPARIAAFRAMLAFEGRTVTDWATENGEVANHVHKVLSGTRSCSAGASHRIAVKLGLKDGAPAPVACA